MIDHCNSSNDRWYNRRITTSLPPCHDAPHSPLIFFSFQIGINPGLFAAYKGHHYAGPGNHFCKYRSLACAKPIAAQKKCDPFFIFYPPPAGYLTRRLRNSAPYRARIRAGEKGSRGVFTRSRKGLLQRAFFFTVQRRRRWEILYWCPIR